MRDLEIKGFGPFEIKDADKGEVTAVVATLGVVDKDGDVILPGAIPPNSKVKLSGYGHDVVLQNAPPAGIGVINEVGDKAIFTGRFFLATDRGREAFEVVKELGSDGQWSFGFPIGNAKRAKLTDEWKAKGARQVYERIFPVEASPVFIGAGHGTGTLAVKAAESLTDRMEAVHNALWARNDSIREDQGEQMDPEAMWYAHEIFDDYVIVRAGAKMRKVSYTVAEDGSVTLGESVEVEVVYQEVEGTEQKAATPEIEKPKVDSEDELAAKRAADELAAKEAEIKAKASEEFERLQRNMRKFA